jgi:predicted O-methyltransferase YrrM
MTRLIGNLFRKFTTFLKDPKPTIGFIQSGETLSKIKPKDPEATRLSSWDYGKIAREPLIEVFPGIEKVNVKLFRTFDRDLDTSITAQEILVLCSIVSFTKAKNVLEIGTYNGNTALNLAVNTPPDATITTIDLPPDWDGALAFDVPEDSLNATDITEIGIQYKNTKFVEKINQVYGDSAKLNWKKLPIPFDLVFIDGCHHYKYVKHDTEKALKHLRAGGIIIWHDYGMIKEVSSVVDEFTNRLNIRVIQGTRLAVGFVK